VWRSGWIGGGTAGLGRPAAVVLAVKMPDLDAAIEACAAWPDTPIVTLQNGIGAEEAVVAARAGARCWPHR